MLFDKSGEEQSRHDVRQAIYRLLSRREYARLEIRQKLKTKNFLPEHVDAVLLEMVEEGLVSDTRYAEMLIKSRQNRGYGPIKIQMELEQNGLDPQLINELLDGGDEQWNLIAREVAVKKGKALGPQGLEEKPKLMRFLQYRGFSASQINAALDGFSDEL